MKFCAEHWTKLRAAIDDVGLTALIPEGGEAAMKSMVSELDGSTVDNFDPLMRAHNMIFSRAMEEIKTKYTQNPLMLMADDHEHPEWACPICALNWCHAEHDRLCKQEGCTYPKEYDWTDEMMGVAQVVLDDWKGLKA
jgi:hypothetical protein